jgi:hypothetical protein
VMAGRGPAPKDPGQRRRRNEPARGEWVELEALKGPVLPLLPKRGKGEGSWSPRTRAVWAAWRADPATSQYGPAEVAAAVELAWIFEAAVRGEERASEVRLRMDGLGLSAKGKRDLRWRSPTEQKPSAAPVRLAEVRRLRAVDPAA